MSYRRIKQIILTVVAFFILLTNVFASQLQASWYSNSSLIKEGTWKEGKERKMANGKRFDENAFTCACRIYPLGSWLRITNMQNNRWVEVLVTDRIGKRFATTRVDLAKSAFAKIANCKQGLVPVKIERIK